MTANIFPRDLAAPSGQPKFRRLVEAVTDAVSEGRLHQGDLLPSVNQLCTEFALSRDTVFKAYTILKEQGTIDSIPSKGYFVADQMKKVFVFLDTFKAYKEVLYDAFVKNLPRNVIADVNFHHYNPQVFKKLIEDSIGKYSKYVVMPFSHEVAREALQELPADKLLIIDWDLYATEQNSVVCQDFSTSLSAGLQGVLHLLRKYNEVHFLYPEYTNHPHESVDDFVKFCQQNDLKYVVEYDSKNFEVKVDTAYISVSDRMLGRFLEQCLDRKLEIGRDAGVVSYNETPMKKFILRGSTVFSTDFEQMGRTAAEFVSGDARINRCIPSKIIIRESL